MTMSHVHRNDVVAERKGSRFAIARIRRRIAAAFRAMHRAIAAAKLHRLRNELMLHRSTAEYVEFDAAKYPQRPMILGEKWDF
jgi:hypothetical protein